MPKSAPLVLERSEDLVTDFLTLIIDLPAQGGSGGDYSIKFYRFKLTVFSQDELYQVSNATWNGTSWVQDDATKPSFLKRIGANITYAGQDAGTGPWNNNSWVECLDIVPFGVNRGLRLDDFQIAWDNTTTGAAGANPPASTVLKNTLVAKNTIKAWGLVETDSGGQTIHDGFGISGASFSGTDLEIDFAFLMDSTDYVVICTENLGSLNGLIPSITFKSGITFRIRMTRHDGTVFNADGATTWFAGFIVMGLHNT